MTVHTLLTALALLTTSAHAHYSFGNLVVNGTYSNIVWKYIRQPGPPSASETSGEWQPGKPGAPLSPFLPPIPLEPSLRATPLTSQHVLTPSFRCGREGWLPHDGTSTADVLAGEMVGFMPEVFFGVTPPFVVGIYGTITHIGPAQAYLAKKPKGVQLSQWDGDGDWFKIDYTGPTSNTTWALLGATQYNVTIPKTTPPGEYLLRVEHLYPSTGNTSEFFVNCAQINIIGSGGGTPTGFVKFPGAYQPDEPALSLPEGEEIVNGTDAAALRWRSGFLGYVPPGPAVWSG